MAAPRLTTLVAALIVSVGACDRQPEQGSSSITVKLPPPRQRIAGPAFTFRTAQYRQSH